MPPRLTSGSRSTRSLTLPRILVPQRALLEAFGPIVSTSGLLPKPLVAILSESLDLWNLADAAAKVDESVFRRQAMVIVLAFILVGVAFLFITKRRLDRELEKSQGASGG